MATPQLQGVATGLVSSSGGSTDITGKNVLFYFSAHWCPPCRRFTPILAEAYKSGALPSKNCEVIFVSADKDQSSFDSYFSEQPWLAVPFSDEAQREELQSKFDVEGFPTLIAVAPDGSIISKKARGLFMEDQTLANFPLGWTAPKHAGECLADMPIVNKSLASSDWTTDVASKDIVGLYFSAHWCGPCRRFTPQLVKWYNAMKAAGHSIEIVFISSDKSQGDWMEYFSTMPWLALNVWDDAGKAAKQRLDLLEGVVEHRGIPHLALLKGSDLSQNFISGDATSKIRGDIDGFPWLPKPCEAVDVALESINEKPVAMLITTSDAAPRAVTAMEEAAVPYFGDSAPPRAPVCTVVSTDHETYGRLAGFLGLSSVTLAPAESLLCVCDIPSGRKFLTMLTGASPSVDDLTLAIAAFIAERGDAIGIRDVPTTAQLRPSL